MNPRAKECGSMIPKSEVFSKFTGQDKKSKPTITG